MISPGTLLADIPARHTVWMSHGDSVTMPPAGFDVLASRPARPRWLRSRTSAAAWPGAVAPRGAAHEHGQKVLEHFLVQIAGCRQTWTMVNIVEDSDRVIRAQIGDRGQAICGLSGGVDSAVAAAIVQRAIGDRLTCVRRPRADAAGRDRAGRARLRGGDRRRPEGRRRGEAVPRRAGRGHRPEEKRKIIGREFIRVFEAAEADVLGQKMGTTP